MMTLVSSDELAKDVTGAEALRERHKVRCIHFRSTLIVVIEKKVHLYVMVLTFYGVLSGLHNISMYGLCCLL